MIYEMKKRKYTLKKRAEQKEETRERIVDAAIALHEELGPKFTTISAIADRAGVERLTVYRHFPTEESIFGACSEKWYSSHPSPEAGLWKNIKSPEQRSRTALKHLYRYYRSTGGMWTSLYRDAADVAAAKDSMQSFESYLTGFVNDLLHSWKTSGVRRTKLRIALSHAVRFSTWKSLNDLKDDEIAELMVLWQHAIVGH
jgi:AcrR family transcriptional regulator